MTAGEDGGVAFTLLAHSGGFSWDEMLFLLAPVLIFGALLAAAKRKAAQAEEGETSDEGPPG